MKCFRLFFVYSIVLLLLPKDVWATGVGGGMYGGGSGGGRGRGGTQESFARAYQIIRQAKTQARKAAQEYRENAKTRRSRIKKTNFENLKEAFKAKLEMEKFKQAIMDLHAISPLERKKLILRLRAEIHATLYENKVIKDTAEIKAHKSGQIKALLKETSKLKLKFCVGDSSPKRKELMQAGRQIKETLVELRSLQKLQKMGKTNACLKEIKLKEFIPEEEVWYNLGIRRKISGSFIPIPPLTYDPSITEYIDQIPDDEQTDKVADQEKKDDETTFAEQKADIKGYMHLLKKRIKNFHAFAVPYGAQSSSNKWKKKMGILKDDNWEYEEDPDTEESNIETAPISTLVTAILAKIKEFEKEKCGGSITQRAGRSLFGRKKKKCRKLTPQQSKVRQIYSNIKDRLRKFQANIERVSKVNNKKCLEGNEIIKSKSPNMPVRSRKFYWWLHNMKTDFQTRDRTLRQVALDCLIMYGEGVDLGQTSNDNFILCPNRQNLIANDAQGEVERCSKDANVSTFPLYKKICHLQELLRKCLNIKLPLMQPEYELPKIEAAVRGGKRAPKPMMDKKGQKGQKGGQSSRGTSGTPRKVQQK